MGLQVFSSFQAEVRPLHHFAFSYCDSLVCFYSLPIPLFISTYLICQVPLVRSEDSLEGCHITFTGLLLLYIALSYSSHAAPLAFLGSSSHTYNYLIMSLIKVLQWFYFYAFFNFAIDFLFKYVLKNCLRFSRYFPVCHQSLELFYSLEIEISIRPFVLSFFCDPHREMYFQIGKVVVSWTSTSFDN